MTILPKCVYLNKSPTSYSAPHFYPNIGAPKAEYPTTGVIAGAAGTTALATGAATNGAAYGAAIAWLITCALYDDATGTE